MAEKATTTTPDPELSTALGSGNEVNANAPENTLGGANARGEVAGCPTGMMQHPQAQRVKAKKEHLATDETRIKHG
jgi:hypothetical protein